MLEELLRVRAENNAADTASLVQPREKIQAKLQQARAVGKFSHALVRQLRGAVAAAEVSDEVRHFGRAERGGTGLSEQQKAAEGKLMKETSSGLPIIIESVLCSKTTANVRGVGLGGEGGVEAPVGGGFERSAPVETS